MISRSEDAGSRRDKQPRFRPWIRSRLLRILRGDTFYLPPYDAPHSIEWPWATAALALMMIAIIAALNSAWIVVAVALSLCVLSWLKSLVGMLAESTYDRGRKPPPGEETLAESSRHVASMLDQANAVLFISALLEPSGIYTRVKESVSQLSRAYLVATRYTVQIPQDDATASSLDLPRTNEAQSRDAIVLPVLLSRKGVLHDDLTIKHEGAELASLSFGDFVELAVEALHLIEPLDDAVKQQVRDAIASRASRAPTATELSTLMQSLERHPTTIAVLELLVSHYCIAVVVPRQAVSAGAVVIETTERVLMPATVSDYAIEPGRRERPAHEADNPSWARWQRRIAIARGIAQALSGARPSTIVFPTQKALYSRSYHLEVMGSPGTYLVRQDFLPNGFHYDYARYRARNGQRYAHFYTRGGRSRQPNERLTPNGRSIGLGPRPEPLFVTEFKERTPGNYAGAAFASLTCAVLLFIAFRTASLGSRTDLMALLIAAPATLAGVAGFRGHGSGVVGASPIPKVVSLLTFAASLGAIAQYLLGGTPYALFAGSSFPWTATWQVLIATSVGGLALSCGSWIAAAIREATFVDRGAYAYLEAPD